MQKNKHGIDVLPKPYESMIYPPEEVPEEEPYTFKDWMDDNKLERTLEDSGH